MNLRKLKSTKKIIGRVTKTKYLGLNINENHSWKDQYKKVKARDILPQSKLAAVYRALIESHLRYGNIIWGCISDTKLGTLQKLQSRARNIDRKRKMVGSVNRCLSKNL